MLLGLILSLHVLLPESSPESGYTYANYVEHETTRNYVDIHQTEKRAALPFESREDVEIIYFAFNSGERSGVRRTREREQNNGSLRTRSAVFGSCCARSHTRESSLVEVNFLYARNVLEFLLLVSLN
jgi:hypothetical protein